MAVAACLLATTPAFAGISISVTPDTQTGFDGQTLSYFGTVTNTTGSDVVITSPYGANDNPQITQTDTFATPQTFTAGQSFTGELFTVTIGPNVAPGVYHGIYGLSAHSVSGGADQSGQFNYFTNVVPTPTPEPGTLGMLSAALGAAVVAGKRRRYSKTSRPQLPN